MKRIILSALFVSAVAAAAHAGVITSGHADLDIDYTAASGSGGDLTLTWRTYSPMSAGTPANDDNYPIAGNPISVPLGNTYVVPNTSNWDCLGRGTTIYRLRQSELAGQVWLGYNTQNVATGIFVDNKVQLELTSVVSAPVGGTFVAYYTNGAGVPQYLLNTTAGACNRTSFPGGIATGVHNHLWWTFSVAGTYTLRFRASGTLLPALGGGIKYSSTQDVVFQIP